MRISGGGPHTALQYTAEFPTFSPDHKMGVGYVNKKIPYSKKHVRPVSQLSLEYTPFKPRKFEPPADGLGKGLVPRYRPTSPVRRVVNSKLVRVGERYICSNLSETMCREIKSEQSPIPVRDLLSNENQSFGKRMKNGVQVPCLGRRLKKQEPWEEPDSMMNPLLRDELIRTQRGHIPTPTNSPRRDQQERIFRFDDVPCCINLSDRPQQRNLREHRNYFPGVPDIGGVGERRHVSPPRQAPRAESIRVFSRHRNAIDRVGRLLQGE
eukprot:GEMP01066369.1.p1 GENE.GEMP01066369.1~~GEMP01066369.1.p1  ORF type:complete len:267 (+),score=41.76 GEMP01066369.1:148-948(+)